MCLCKPCTEPHVHSLSLSLAPFLVSMTVSHTHDTSFLRNTLSLSNVLLSDPLCIHWDCLTGTLFDRIVIIVLENTSYNTDLQQSYFKALTTHTSPNGRLLSNYDAVAHPSLARNCPLLEGLLLSLFKFMAV